MKAPTLARRVLDSSESVPRFGGERPTPGRPLVVRGPKGADPALDAEPCVLLIDDEPEALESLGELVELEGMNARTASNGAEALAMLRQGTRPFLIVVDLKMPVLDGWGFCRAVADDGNLREIPIAIVSASAAIVSLPQIQRYAGFFSKPIDVPRFLAMVRRYCS
jgi:CheY-like chemotaxis protein